MGDAVTNTIVKFLNVNHSPEDAMKLVMQFLSIAVQQKLKLDLELIDEIIATIIHNFLEFIDQLAMEDMKRLFQIVNDLHDIPHV